MSGSGNGQLPIALELMLAVMVTPLLTYLIFYFQAKRQKDDRFDEIRHQTYVLFTHQIIETLRQTDVNSARNGLSQAWLHYESILLSSEYSVICSCWNIRIAVEKYLNSLGQEVDIRPNGVQEFKEAAWDELHFFHVLARKELGLGDLSVEQIKREQSRYLQSTKL